MHLCYYLIINIITNNSAFWWWINNDIKFQLKQVQIEIHIHPHMRVDKWIIRRRELDILLMVKEILFIIPYLIQVYPYLLKICKISLRNTLIYFKSFLKLSNLKIITNLYIILYHRNVIFEDENNHHFALLSIGNINIKTNIHDIIFHFVFH